MKTCQTELFNHATAKLFKNTGADNSVARSLGALGKRMVWEANAITCPALSSYRADHADHAVEPYCGERFSPLALTKESAAQSGRSDLESFDSPTQVNATAAAAIG